MAHPTHHDPTSSTAATVTSGGIVLTAAMTATGVGNYALNAVFARWLTPAEFGDATLVVTLMLVVSAVAGCFQLAIAKQVAASPASGAGVSPARRTAWMWGAIGLVLVVGAATALPAAQAFDVDSGGSLIVFGIGIPLQLAIAVERGLLQGRLAFRRLGLSYVVEMMVRVIAGVALVATGAGVLGVAVSLWLSLAAALLFLHPRLPTARRGAPGIGLRNAIGPTAAILAAQVVISHGDLVVVKHRFGATEAGAYAVIALLGRAFYAVTWSAATAAFPAGARLKDDPSQLRRVVRGGVAALGIAGLVVVAVSWLWGKPAVALLFSDAYTERADLLGPYVLATVLFIIANYVAMIDLARGVHRTTACLLIGAVVQSTLVATAPNLDQVVWGQVVAMAGTLVASAVIRRDVVEIPTARFLVRRRTESAGAGLTRGSA